VLFCRELLIGPRGWSAILEGRFASVPNPNRGVTVSIGNRVEFVDE